MGGKAMMLGPKHRALREQPPHLAFGHPIPALRGEGHPDNASGAPSPCPSGEKVARSAG